MNITNRLPDDLQYKIYYHLHKSYMINIKDELKKNIIERWDKLSIYEQEDYIDENYPTKFAIYSLYDKNDKLRNPNEILFYDKCRIYETDYYHNEGVIYKGKVLKNATYGDVFLEVDKFIEHSVDYHHTFLEDVAIEDVIEDNSIYNIHKIEFYLGS